MSPVIVEVPERYGDAISARIVVDGVAETLIYRATPGPVTEDADPFLAAALVPAMAVRQPIVVHAPVSPALLKSVHPIQGTLVAWKVGLTEVPVEAVPRAPRAPAGRVGAFFSGGVDSFYTALKRRAEVDALIFLHGFDVAPARGVESEPVIAGARAAAAELGTDFVVIGTGYRKWSTRYVVWKFAAAGIIGSSVLALSPQFRRIYVPSSHSYADAAPPYGTHPLLDPLWSTEEVEVVHDGYEATRLEKLRAIANDEVFLRHVHVCYRTRRGDTYNCGSCHKCVRAAIYLMLAGSLDGCSVLPNRLDPEVVARASIPQSLIANWELDLREVEGAGGDAAITAAMRTALRRSRAERLKARLRPWSRRGHGGGSSA